MLTMATTLPTTNNAGENNKMAYSQFSTDDGDDIKNKSTKAAPMTMKPNSGSDVSGRTSSSNSTISLHQFHQPYISNGATIASPPSLSSAQNNLSMTMSANNHITLPPISSFDNLIRAAEKQYTKSASNSNMNSSTATTVNVIPSASPTFLSYQLSTTPNNASNTTVPRSIIQQRPSSVASSTSSTSSSFSPIASMSIASPNLEASLSPLLSTSNNANDNRNNNISLSNQQNTLKIHKPRKKKECPICHNFYANLSTHKSTHLTPENRPHKCPVCQRGFARNNDLIRHKKRHWKDEIIENSLYDSSTDIDEQDHQNPHTHPHLHHLDEHDQLRSLHQIKGTFKCPFNSSLIQLDMEIYPYKSKPLNFETSNCHQTGVFSRCDTFKNHLKALHFEYPPGTKKRDRAIVPGRCKHCGLKFQNVDVWLNDHVCKSCGYSYH